MIIDSHAYCFPPADSPAGYASTDEHMRWVQAGQAGHYQPAFDIATREAGSSLPLAPDGTKDLARLPDVGFRVDSEAGRILWTADGRDFTKHYYPPSLRDCAYPPAGLISEMDYAGVDMAFLHTHPMLARDSAYQAACIARFPGRLLSMAPVDEGRIRDDVDAVIGDMATAIETHRLHAIKFNGASAYMVSDDPWDDGFYRPFWEAATALSVPIFFTLDNGPEHASWENSARHQAGYLNELAILTRWMERYPDALCSITHGFPYRTFMAEGRVVLPEDIWRPFESPNLSIEVSFPVRIGDMFDFPYREIWPAIEEMVGRIGAGQLMWGTDLPFQNRHCTYLQSRALLEKYCAFLDAGEVDAIMGGTVARVLGLEAGGG